MDSFDTIVVGAGIVGASCALELTRAGMTVLVLDRAEIGGGTTAAGMGHIVVLDDCEAQLALSRYSQQLWHDIAGDLPNSVEMWQCGTIWIAADSEEMQEVHRKFQVYKKVGLTVEILDENTLYQAEPHLRPGLAGGLLVQSDSVLYPPAATYYLLNQAKQYQTEIRTGIEVSAIIPDGGVLLADGQKVSADRIIIAAGCFSPYLSPELPVRRRKGHLVVTERYPNFVNHQLVELGYLKSAHSMTADSVAFNIQPRKTGQMLIGSSRQFDTEDHGIDYRILTRMLDRAFEYIPDLRSAKAIRGWTGFRPATPDKLPVIGPDPGHEAVWLATGHEGLGITTALGTGRIIRDMILGQQPEINIEPFSPMRFMRVGLTHG